MNDGAYNNSAVSSAGRSFKALEYMLAVTMEVPSPKAAALARYSGRLAAENSLGRQAISRIRSKRLRAAPGIPEEMFLHFKFDSNVTLHLHHEMVNGLDVAMGGQVILMNPFCFI
jgi:hypothetical protein